MNGCNQSEAANRNPKNLRTLKRTGSQRFINEFIAAFGAPRD